LDSFSATTFWPCGCDRNEPISFGAVDGQRGIDDTPDSDSQEEIVVTLNFRMAPLTSAIEMISIHDIYHIPQWRPAMTQGRSKTTAKLFMHGRSQAVRLPKEFRLPGKEVRVSRMGDRVILEPIDKPQSFDAKAFWAEIDALGDKPFMPEGREQPAMPPNRHVFEE
jgi:antitoxin VapB